MFVVVSLIISVMMTGAYSQLYLYIICIYSAIAKARENVISDAISDNSGSFKVTTPTSGGAVQPLTQRQLPTAEKKGQRSPAHAPQALKQSTVTVTLKDAPITKVDDDVMMM